MNIINRGEPGNFFTDVNFNNNRGINVSDPINAQDAVTKNYLESVTDDLESKTQNISLINTVSGTTVITGTLSATNFDTSALGASGKLTTSRVSDNTDVAGINLSASEIDIVAINVKSNGIDIMKADGSIPMTNNLNMNVRNINNVSDPLISTDAATKNYVDTADSAKLSLSGGTMTGQLISQNIIPDVSGTYALGTSLKKFSDIKSTNGTIDDITCNFGTINNAPTVGTDIINRDYLESVTDDLESKTQNIDLSTTVAGTTALNGIFKFVSSNNVTMSSIDANRIKLESADKGPSFFASNPAAVASSSTELGKFIFGRDLNSFGSGLLTYVYNGTDRTTPNINGNLNQIRIAHSGSGTSRFDLFADGSFYIGGTVPKFKFDQGNKAGVGLNGLTLLDTTPSTSTTTGTIITASGGGIGCGGNMHIGEQLTIANHPIGEFFFVNNVTATVVLLNTWTAVVAIASTSDITAAEFTHNSLGRLTYTGIATRQFRMSHTGTFLGTTATDVTACVGFMKNGSFLPGAKSCWETINDVENYTSSVQKITTLATNDYIELGVINETNTDSLIVRNCNLEIIALF